MRRSMFSILIASVALGALAHDGVELSLKTKALAASSTGSPAVLSSSRQAEAPFVYARDPMPQLIMLEEVERRSAATGRCELSGKDLCYDIADGRIVYRAAREWMPKFDGLTPENISVRSNRVVFRYSFK
jgi:hypothetical protein